VQAGQELATFLNAIVGIVSEDAVEVEVVKITHDTFELDLSLRVQIDYFLQVSPVQVTPSQRLASPASDYGQRMVIPSTLVETERPVRLETRRADNTSVILADDLLRGRSTQKVQVKASTNGAVCNRVGSQQPILTMRVARVHSVRRGGFVVLPIPGLDINRMRIVAVDVDLLIIVKVVGVPERLRPVVAQPEAMDGCREAVDVVVGDHVGHQFQELIFEDDLVAVGIEYDFSRAHTCNAELETGFVGPSESEVA